jgi:predicted enzyme related to lactoylglutathione lyase
MPKDATIDYVEFPASDLLATKQFFSAVFGWSFQDYGDGYTCFVDQGINGGFFKSDLCSVTSRGAALVVMYAQNLEETQQRVEQAGGTITRPIFSFPGGRRFHFTEPSGNELAVWSDHPE